MTNEEKLKLEQSIKRGNLAKSVIDNPVYQEALLSIRGELMRAFEQTKFKDSADRDEIWRKMQVMNWFEARLQKIMKNGVIAEKTLLEQAKEKVHTLFKRR